MRWPRSAYTAQATKKVVNRLCSYWALFCHPRVDVLMARIDSVGSATCYPVRCLIPCNILLLVFALSKSCTTCALDECSLPLTFSLNLCRRCALQHSQRRRTSSHLRLFYLCARALLSPLSAVVGHGLWMERIQLCFENASKRAQVCDFEGNFSFWRRRLSRM